MRAANVDIEVPGKVEDSRRRGLSAVEMLNGQIAEIESQIDSETRSIHALEEEREYKVALPFERSCEISQLIGESNGRIETLRATLSDKRSKLPAATAALREAETKVNTILKGSLVSRIEAAAAELAQMEESLRSEQSVLNALVAQRGEISRAVSLGKAGREKLQEVGARILDSQNHVEGVSAAVEPAKAALDALRAELRETEKKLGDLHALNEIEKLKEKGTRVAEVIVGKLKEVGDSLDSLQSLTDLQQAANACRMELRAHGLRARTLATRIAGEDAVVAAAWRRRE